MQRLKKQTIFFGESIDLADPEPLATASHLPVDIVMACRGGEAGFLRWCKKGHSRPDDHSLFSSREEILKAFRQSNRIEAALKYAQHGEIEVRIMFCKRGTNGWIFEIRALSGHRGIRYAACAVSGD